MIQYIKIIIKNYQLEKQFKVCLEIMLLQLGKRDVKYFYFLINNVNINRIIISNMIKIKYIIDLVYEYI